MEARLLAVLTRWLRVRCRCRRCAGSWGSPGRRSTSTGDGARRKGRPGWRSVPGGRSGHRPLIPAELEDEIVRLRKELAAGQWGPDDRLPPGPRRGVGRCRRWPRSTGCWSAAVWSYPQPHKRPLRRRGGASSGPAPTRPGRSTPPAGSLSDGQGDVDHGSPRRPFPGAAAARVFSAPPATPPGTPFAHAASRVGTARPMSCPTTGPVFHPPIPQRRRKVAFERDLRALGIRHILSSPGHPQTCGKLERFHQTLKRWLRAQPPALDPRPAPNASSIPSRPSTTISAPTGPSTEPPPPNAGPPTTPARPGAPLAGPTPRQPPRRPQRPATSSGATTRSPSAAT